MFRDECFQGTEITSKEMGLVNRETLSRRGVIQAEINAATMPKNVWPLMEQFLETFFVPGKKRVGLIEESSGQVMINPSPAEPSRKNSYLGDLFATPYHPMTVILRRIFDGTYAKAVDSKSWPINLKEFGASNKVDVWSQVLVDLREHRRILTLKCWLWYLVEHFVISGNRPDLLRRTCNMPPMLHRAPWRLELV